MEYDLFALEPSWRQALKHELCQPYMAHLAAFIEREQTSGVAIYPTKQLIFNAFWQTPLDQVKVLIMGQDPYHGPGQAHGLCFSVPEGVPPPPSLQNIYKEIAADLGIPAPGHGCLIKWARQGVMLLNATLTVRQAEPLSHHGKGWERFTDAVIEALCNRSDPVIFVLWGKSAKDKCLKVKGMSLPSQHDILTAPHPSPLSAHQGFLGCRHFSKINEILTKRGQTPIDWSLKN
jgi:uracil-DNA glycosylase